APRPCPARPRTRPKRHVLVVLVLLLLPVPALAARSVWKWSDLDPRPTFALTATGWAVALGCWIALPVWIFLYSGWSGRARAVVAGVMLLGLGGTVAAIDSIAFNGDLEPIPHFRWQPRAEDVLMQYLDEQEDGQGLPPIDLTVDPLADFPRYRGGRG